MRVLLSDGMGASGRDYTAQWAVTLVRDFAPWKHGRHPREKRFEPRWPRSASETKRSLEEGPRRGSVPEEWIR